MTSNFRETLAIALFPAFAFASAPANDVVTFKDCDRCPEMVAISPGSFMMGGDYARVVGEENIRPSLPVHRVNINYPFAVGKYKVTVGDYRMYTDSIDDFTDQDNNCGVLQSLNDINSDGEPRNWDNPGFQQDEDHPVVCVSWASAIGYLRWLSEKTGKTYRLLSEAEWEYVARSNRTHEDLRRQGFNEYANSGLSEGFGGGVGENDHWEFTAPGNAFAPNPFGVYDMAGNAIEHVGDCVNGDYVGAPSDGAAWRVVERINNWSRGGSTADFQCVDHVGRGRPWNTPPMEQWYNARSWWRIHTSQNFVGFRVMRLLDQDDDIY